MSFHASQRIDRVQTPVIPVIAQWIRQHPGTISLGQGVVRYSPPAQVAAAVAEAAGANPRLSGYGFVRGTDELLAEIRRKVERENGISIDARRCIVATAGSNMGFLNAIMAIADVGDEIILNGPYYFNHEMAIGMIGCRTVAVDTDENQRLDLAAIEAAIGPRTRAVVTISPCNPTGVVSTRETLTRVNRICRERGIYHISDEAYEYFVYGDQPHFSPGSLPASAEHTICLYSLSKAYGMAGWRTAYMIIPAHLETAIKKIQDTNLICPPIITQVAAAAALRVGRDWCLRQNRGLREIRDLVIDQLRQLGDRVRVPRPDGAFYVLVTLDSRRNDQELVEALIRDYGVAVLPGSTFGSSRLALRIAYGALDRDSVAEGMGRLVRGLNALL